MDQIRLSTRFLILLAGIIALSLIMYVFWSSYIQQKLAIKEMHEKAYVLSQQLDAVWEFMSINQDRINYDANGEYNFKGLHCSLVGKSIGKLFQKKTDYVIRYVNDNPRNKEDVPDTFEGKALNRFREDNTLTEIYEMTDYNGVASFRYVAPMNIDTTCLDCHGNPAGEPDVLGYAKEGWQIGDLAGVLSIVMPVDIYVENKKHNLRQEVIFFCLLMFLCTVIIYYATARLVTNPLNKLKLVTEHIKSGDLNMVLNPADINAQGEIKDLTIHFDAMITRLRGVYNDLENKVRLRTKDLAHANTILESQQIQLEKINLRLMEDNKYKSDFLAIMSHELRTPLTSILAFTEVLEKMTVDRSPKEIKIIEEIKTNNLILLSLINNILDMARLEAGKTELLVEPVDLVDVINAVANVIEPLAARKKLDFSARVALDVPIIEADKEKLRRIVENLTSNAIKFTRGEGCIRLWVEYDSENNNVLINVEDNGIGISQEEQELIFDKFVQGDSSIHRPYNGSGLGLTLARELTELHGGRIELKSELGKGSLFVVVIPANLCGEEASESENNAGG